MRKKCVLLALICVAAGIADEGYSVVNQMETMYAGTHAGYHQVAHNDGSRSDGAHFEINAAGFWSVGGPHKIGLAFGMGSASNSYSEENFKLTSSGVSLQLSPIYRAGSQKKYMDASFTMSIPVLYNLYIERPEYHKEKIYVDASIGYSIELFGRYGFIGAGIGRSLSANITPFTVRGFWTAHRNIEVIPSLAYCLGGSWNEFALSLGANYFV